MILTFDPSGLKSGYECVDFLKNKGIIISQKLGARLIALNSRKIQITPAVLEDACPGSPLEGLFLSRALTDDDLFHYPHKIRERACEAGVEALLGCVLEEDILKIASPLELETIEEVHAGLPVLSQSPSQFLNLTSISPHSILSDRRYMEEMTLNFLDSEDPRVIIESLRKLTRIVLMSGKDPGSLFRKAFAREDMAIWTACASIIKEMINYDIGMNLESFLKEKDFEKRKGAFRIVLNDAIAQPDSFLGEWVLQIVIKSLLNKNSFSLFSDNRAALLRLMKRYPSHLEEFIKNIFSRYYEYSPEELWLLREFLHQVAKEYAELSGILMDELKKNNPGQYKIIITWILSPLALSSGEEACMITILKGLLKENIRDPNLMSMMKTALLRLSPNSLILLSTRDYYSGIERDVRLFILELWEGYMSATRASASQCPDFLEIILTELNGIDLAMQKSILRLKTMQDPEVLRRLKNRVFNSSTMIEAAAFTFVSHQNIDETTYLFRILQELIPDAPGLCFNLLEKKYYLEEEFEDYIPFLAHLITISYSSPGQESALLSRVLEFLNTLSRDKRIHGPMATEAIGVIYSRVAWKKNKVSMFVKRITDQADLPFEVRIKTLSALYLSSNLTARAKTVIEDFFLQILRTRQMRSPDLSYMLEQMNDILNRGRMFSKTDDFVDIFKKEIAFKLTQPTITEIMRSEASSQGPSRFMSQYETNPWKWEDVTEALFILLKMYMDRKSTARRRDKILHLISYLVHHWSISAARKDDASRFFLADIVLFRILRDLIDSVSKEQSPPVSRIMNSVLTLVGKGREALVMNGDLQHFLVASCRVLDEEEGDTDFPLDIRRETIRLLIWASQNNSGTALSILEETLNEGWLGDDSRALVTSYLKTL